METNDADTVDALEVAAKALAEDAKPKTLKTKTDTPKYEAYDHEGNTVQLDDKRRRSTVVNMSEWIPADKLDQWEKDHPQEQQEGS